MASPPLCLCGCGRASDGFHLFLPGHSPVTCTVNGCSEPTRCRGLCNGHWLRQLRGRPSERPIVKPRTFEERFWAKVDRRGPDECWPWLGAKSLTQRGYYGVLNLGRRGVGVDKAHRIAYRLAGGVLAPRQVVDHLCRNTLCVNHAHLEAITTSVNTQRGHDYRRANGIPDSHLKEYCKRGHPLSGANLYVWRGHHHCLACQQLRKR